MYQCSASENNGECNEALNIWIASNIITNPDPPPFESAQELSL